jgi:hypothetical protein
VLAVIEEFPEKWFSFAQGCILFVLTMQIASNIRQAVPSKHRRLYIYIGAMPEN